MRNIVSINKFKLLNKTRTIGLIVLVFLSLTACKEDKKETIKSFKDLTHVPTLLTKNVSTLISDSGITRYRLVTAEWSVFERVNEPYWYFPKGIYVEKFDSIFRVEASIKADSAYFIEGRKLWHLKKNVKILNLQGEKFETEDLYWDQFLQKIYSDSFIKIEQQKRIITGIGFESNESMTRYLIHKTQGIFDVDDTNSEPQP
ncbi:MAG: LPS export ABC transporter periplasmic protein LptC [Bacteroidales bacterium]|nr:LPS export ABC transporter periplasmic protein LptC [Bacteroidales bacterium]